MLEFVEDHFFKPNRATRVTLDGVDVSKDCYAFDERTGFVGLFRRKADGRQMRDEQRRPMKTFRRGRVEVFRDPLARSRSQWLTVAQLRKALDEVPADRQHIPLRSAYGHKFFAVDTKNFNHFVNLIP